MMSDFADGKELLFPSILKIYEDIESIKNSLDLGLIKASINDLVTNYSSLNDIVESAQRVINEFSSEFRNSFASFNNLLSNLRSLSDELDSKIKTMTSSIQATINNLPDKDSIKHTINSAIEAAMAAYKSEIDAKLDELKQDIGAPIDLSDIKNEIQQLKQSYEQAISALEQKIDNLGPIDASAVESTIKTAIDEAMKSYTQKLGQIPANFKDEIQNAVKNAIDGKLKDFESKFNQLNTPDLNLDDLKAEIQTTKNLINDLRSVYDKKFDEITKKLKGIHSIDPNAIKSAVENAIKTAMTSYKNEIQSLQSKLDTLHSPDLSSIKTELQSYEQTIKSTIQTAFKEAMESYTQKLQSLESKLDTLHSPDPSSINTVKDLIKRIDELEQIKAPNAQIDDIKSAVNDAIASYKDEINKKLERLEAISQKLEAYDIESKVEKAFNEVVKQLENKYAGINIGDEINDFMNGLVSDVKTQLLGDIKTQLLDVVKTQLNDIKKQIEDSNTQIENLRKMYENLDKKLSESDDEDFTKRLDEIQKAYPANLEQNIKDAIDEKLKDLKDEIYRGLEQKVNTLLQGYINKVDEGIQKVNDVYNRLEQVLNNVPQKSDIQNITNQFNDYLNKLEQMIRNQSSQPAQQPTQPTPQSTQSSPQPAPQPTQQPTQQPTPQPTQQPIQNLQELNKRINDAYNKIEEIRQGLPDYVKLMEETQKYIVRLGELEKAMVNLKKEIESYLSIIKRDDDQP